MLDDKTTVDVKASGFEKVEGDMAFLLECFREALEESGEPEFARLLFDDVALAASDTSLRVERLAQLYSMAFQLLNLVEENAATQARGTREANHGMTREAGLWGRTLNELRERGLTGEQIAQALPYIRVEPVLTAHPTEAKRATVLDAHRDLYLLLVKRENPMWTPGEQRQIRREIKALLERLWRAGEIFLDKPDVTTELRNVIHYLRNVFPMVLPLLDRRLRDAWEEAGFDPVLLSEPQSLPRFSFGNWVGGDRDGHPLITPEVTHNSLRALRTHAVELLETQLNALGRRLSLSERLQQPPAFLIGFGTLDCRATRIAR